MLEIFFILIFGLCVGSFLNVVIWRVYKGITLFGRSVCQTCGKIIVWYDNIPVISFFVLRGQCRKCKKGISWQYPLVEMSAGILFILAYIHSAGRFSNFSSEGLFTFLRDIVFISFLIVIFVQDLKWYVILDTITLPLGVLALFFNIALGYDWKGVVLGGIIGGGFFLTQFLISRGRWIGGGDIRLGAVMGLMLGWKLVLAALLAAYIAGAIVAVILLALGKKQWSSRIPFGTFLSLATVVMLLYGDVFLEGYFEWFL